MIRCGFFNSIGDDRRYDAEDMGKLFDGVITDGVFGTMDNEKFKIEIVQNSMNVKVLSGKAWFNGKYFEIERNTFETVTITSADTSPRYDAIYIKIDNTQSEGARVGTLDIQPGSPGSTPTKPTVTSTDNITKVVIGYILVPANVESLNSATVESNIGNTSKLNPCPYSEPSLDPRRAIYAYEGESSVDPTINELIVLTEPDRWINSRTAFFNIPEGFTARNVIIISGQLRHASQSRAWINADIVSFDANGGRGIFVGRDDQRSYDEAKVVLMKWEEPINE